MDLHSLLKLVVHKKASDLFITSGLAPTLKIDGRLLPVSDTLLTSEDTRDFVLGVMTPVQREEFERTHECNFAIGVSGLGRFRVSAFYQRGNVGMTLRRIETRIPTFEELNLPPILKKLSMEKRGIIIFVGGTGTGKSTSLAAMMGYRNQHGTGHLVSIEDPIEFVHQHAGCVITQREVGIDTDSYEIALRNTLRQAPNVIMIGEVRTRETMAHAITFAETGHLCLTTLHANNANQALDRILHFFASDTRDQVLMDLSLNLRAMIAQQLIPKANGKGRALGCEILLNTPLASDYVRKGDVHKLKDLMKRSTNQGMQTFDQHMFKLFQSGEISYDSALRHADSANEVRLMIKLAKGGDAKSLAAGMEGVQVLETED